MIDLAPHQRSAVDRILALLDRYGGAILADEVGLGKSYVAAAVAAAMLAQPIELIVPASLIEQWRTTLRDFAVDARVMSHDSLLGDRFIARPGAKRVLIVDEAHGFRNPRTQRFAALARRSIAARLLLVTATPVCNSADDLFALVSLIAADDSLRHLGVSSIEDAFRKRDAPSLQRIVSELVIRRQRDVLPDELQFGTIRRRVIRHPVLEARVIDDLRFPLIAGGRHHALLRRLLWRRLESSEAALLESIRRQVRFYERALDCLASGRTLTKREYRKAFAGEEDRDALQEVLFWDLFAPQQAIVDAEEIRSELHRLDALRNDVAEAPGVKREMLVRLCREIDEPMLIFTGAVATARDIVAAIAPVKRTGILTSRGAQPIDAIEAFRQGRIDVLVCTDLAAEGLNLQRAGVVVQYDIPWNPVKLDQRNGRAYRIGQKRECVEAIYFLPNDRRTGIVRTVTSKNRTRRQLLDRIESGGVAAALQIRSVLALPQRLTKDAAAVALVRTLRKAGISPPAEIARRYRAGVERLFEEMSREYVDERRMCDLLDVLRSEQARIIESCVHPDRR